MDNLLADSALLELHIRGEPAGESTLDKVLDHSMDSTEQRKTRALKSNSIGMPLHIQPLKKLLHLS